MVLQTDVLQPFPGKHSIVVADNCRIHSDHAFRALVEQHHARLVFLPAYSPDYNPVSRPLVAWLNSSCFDDGCFTACMEAMIGQTNTGIRLTRSCALLAHLACQGILQLLVQPCSFSLRLCMLMPCTNMTFMKIEPVWAKMKAFLKRWRDWVET